MGICFLLLIVGVCWAQYNPNTQAGRTSIVHLFEWRWADIALECERYLAPNGFGGVQISPPNENVIVADPWHPWWERYQPVSYKLCTRSGNETEFRDMVTRCNSVGVHIYVDAVINHMCGGTAGAGNHSTCGSYFNAKTEDFPAVPYSAWDFNDGKCKSESGDIENYHDASQVRNCRLVNLLDLALEKDYVRSKVAEYLNYLIDIGVAGFRIDAAKHMWPEDVKAILDKLKDLNTKWFSAGAKPFIYQEVSPPNENIVITNPFRPWWERYQPISYKLCSRSGNENEFRDMVTRCNNVGVYIYVDAVVNHMCGAAGGSGTHSTCGSYFDAGNENFPAVPYSGWDFNDGRCHTSNGEIQNYGDMYQVRDCRLSGLLDLAQEKDYVRTKIAEYMNYLIDIGVAGFRIDAAKHMWPGDIKAFLDKLNTLNTQWFPSGTKPFIYQEVIDLGGEPITGSQYYGNGRVTEFKYGAKLGTVIRKWNGEKMAYLKNWGEGWGFAPSDRALVFVDNHDNQRGHGAGGASILTFWDARLYKMAVGFMLAHPYGFTRVMSSYRWTRNFVNGKDANDWIGPPSNSDGSTKSVTINADTTCGNDWVCEHRWRQIRNMVIFRNVADGQPFSNWWDNGSNQVAFGRGNKGFIVFNNDDWYMNVNLQTGLPAGTYCDVISGQKEGNACTGKQVYVSGDGTANFQISNTDEDPFVAIHVDAKL